MKTHFLPSEQRARVTRFRATLKILGVFFVCACLAHVASAVYLLQSPPQISVPQAAGNGGSAHDVTLISPQWVISTSNDGPTAVISNETWQSPASLLRATEVSGVRVYLYKLDSADTAHAATLQYPDSGQEVTIQGRPEAQLRLNIGEDGTGIVDQDASAFVGRPVNPVGDSAVLGLIAANANGKAIVITTSQLVKAFPELAR
jgi:hypothetical protein